MQHTYTIHTHTPYTYTEHKYIHRLNKANKADAGKIQTTLHNMSTLLLDGTLRLHIVGFPTKRGPQFPASFDISTGAMRSQILTQQN